MMLNLDHHAHVYEQVLTRRGAALSTLATLFMSGTLCVVLWQAQHDRKILIWFVSMIVVASARWALACQQSFKFVILLETIIGGLWAFVVLACFPPFPQGLQIFFAFIIMGAGLSSALFTHRVFLAGLGAIGFAMPLTAREFAKNLASNNSF